VYIAFLLAFASQTTSAPVDVVETPKTYAWPGTGFGPRFTDGGTGLGEIGISYRLNDWIEPEAVVGMGLHGVSDVQVIDRFSFGARFVLPVDELRPFLWTALHHEHQAQWSAVLSNPVGSTLGISATGVAHYTGAEVGLGASLPFTVEKNVYQAMVRVNLVYLPSFGGMVAGAGGMSMPMHDQYALMVDVAAGLPLRF
jgi:hypothetical protein